MESYKKQITELRAQIDAETKKSDRLEFETKKLFEKVETLSVERDRFLAERDELKEKNQELADEIKFGQAQSSTKASGDLDADSGTLEMIPQSVKERLLRLQHENKMLKSSGSGTSNSNVLQSMLDDMKEREKVLEAEKRKANQRILELESKLEEEVVPRVPGSRQELELKLAEANKKVRDY